MKHTRSLLSGLGGSLIVSCLFSVTPALADTIATFYSLPTDGFMRTAPNTYDQASWDAEHADTTGAELDYTLDKSLTLLIMLDNAGAGSNGTMGFARSFLSCDTSSLPDDATITSAKLHLYVNQVLDNFNDGYES